MPFATDQPLQSLRGLDVFVGGPIQHAILDDGFESGVQSPIETALSTLEAFGAHVFSAHRAERFGADTSHFTPAHVSVRDHRWMHKCDVFVPVLPVVGGVLLRTDGTHIELGWASALGRPIVVVTEIPFAESASHLLKGLDQVGRVRVLDINRLADEPEALAEQVRLAAHPQTLQHHENLRHVS